MIPMIVDKRTLIEYLEHLKVKMEDAPGIMKYVNGYNKFVKEEDYDRLSLLGDMAQIRRDIYLRKVINATNNLNNSAFQRCDTINDDQGHG